MASGLIAGPLLSLVPSRGIEYNLQMGQGHFHAVRQNLRSKNIQELIQASKLTVLGQLAAGIAQELQNPLAVLQLECDEITREIECLSPEERPSYAVHCDAVRRNIGKMLDILEKIQNLSSAPSADSLKWNSREETYLIGESEPIRRLRDLIQKIAPTTSPVLIQGESGTGKEVIAQEIHRLSPRRSQPFVAISCVALVEGVLESELFGHEKGSFTGAISQKLGLLETAEGGTVFLDEIGEVSPALQVKLLRFLQEHEIQRVGGTKTIKVDARIIAATNRDLIGEVVAKRFREDLLYRLNVFDITLPPLRQRADDILLLADHFLKNIQNRLHLSVSLRPEAATALQGYPWPGNVRELENAIERAVVFCNDGTIGLKELPPKIAGLPDPTRGISSDVVMSGKKLLQNLEKEMIRRSLEENRWNQAKAARQLGMKRTTLQYRIHKYALTPHHENPITKN